MNRLTNLIAIVLLLAVVRCSLAAEHPPLQPIKLPKPAETAEEIAQVKGILAEGQRQKKWFRGRVKGVYLPRLNDNRTIGAVGLIGQGVPAAAGWKLTVSHILDDHTMLVILRMGGRKPEDELLCIKGFSTAGIADEDTVRITVLMQVTGTQKFGTRTAFVMEPFPLSPVLGRARPR